MIPGFHFGVSFIAAPVKENVVITEKRTATNIFFIYTLRKHTHTHTFENNNSKDPKMLLDLLLDLMLTWFHFKWSFVKN